MTFHSMWAELLPIGRSSASGGYRRFAWTGADTDCRAWFRQQAESRGLTCELDRNGNQWAWLGDPAAGDAVVTGSHLDSVPDGGAFDGPLGVVSSFAALDELRSRGARFTKPLAIVNFGDEEGARFGLACVGSRLAAGQLTVEQAHRLT
ncbi:M28 family peptidase, partial [Streptomyces sp. NPDC060187]